MGRMRQKPLPGAEQAYIQELDDAADAYHEAKTERQKLTEDEVTHKETLIELMLSHGLAAYETANGVIVTATTKTGCKTKKKAAGAIDDNQVEPDPSVPLT